MASGMGAVLYPPIRLAESALEGLCCINQSDVESLRPLNKSPHALSLRRSEGREAVQDCCPDPELCDLSVEVARHDALTKQLEALHFGLDQGSSVIPAPAPSDRATKAAR